MSKRVQDMQGGAARYGADGGAETPTDTPTRATPAQLARRKIIGLKGRPAMRPQPQSGGDTSFGGFNAGQQPSQQPAQPSFSFSQPSTNGSNMFGQAQAQSQPGTFSFGQSASSSTPFQFGGSGPQSGAFSFGFNGTSGANDGAVRNPFAQATGEQSDRSSPAPASTGFAGNIFNFSQNKPTDTSNGSAASIGTGIFNFGNTPQGGLDAAEQKEVLDRQYILTTDQLKRFEDIVKDKIELWDGNVRSNKLEQLPTDMQRKLLNFVRSLPTPSGTETRSSFALFSDTGRGRTKHWVTDAQRSQIQQAAASMTPEQHEKLAQVARDEFKALSNIKTSEMPALEQLPHDVQFKMFQYSQNPNGATTPAASTPSLFAPAPTAATETSQAKTNAFAGFSFSTASGSPNGQAVKPAESSISSNIFQNIPSDASPTERRTSMAQQKDTNTPSTSLSPQKEAPKSIFSLGKPTGSFSTQPSTTPSLFSFNAPKDVSSTSQPAAFSTKGTGTSSSEAPPARSQSISNPFGSSAPSQPSTGSPLFAAPLNGQPVNGANKVPAVIGKEDWQLRDLNRALLKHLVSCNKSEDWSTALKFYLELLAQKKPHQDTVRGLPASRKRKAEVQIDQFTSEEDVEQSTAGISPAKPQSGFTFTPQKPLSQTASIFNDILAAPNKSPQAAPASQPSSSLFLPPTATSKPAAPSVPTFNASPTNFLAAFGEKAKKQAEKDRAERKAEEFDSDEDDEAEWERKDRERQEAKAKEAANASKKVMKSIDGKFVWVDEAEAEAGAGAGAEAVAVASPPAPLASSERSNTASVFSTQAAPSQGSNLFSFSPGKPTGDAAKPSTTLFPPSAGSSQGIQTQSAPTFNFGSNTAKESTTPTGSPAKPAGSLFSFGTQPPPSRTDDAHSSLKINFGAGAAASPMTSLFSSSNASSGGSSLFKQGEAGAGGPSMFTSANTPSVFATNSSASSSLFASAEASRATTPETRTAGEDQDDDEGAVKEAQRDLTSLSADEVKSEDVLFESKSRLRKFVRGGEEPWETKGVGMLRLLRNKESGKTRILMRQDPSGSVMLNSSLLKNRDMYAAMNDTNVKVTLPGDSNDLSTYRLTFGKKEKAGELIEAIHKVV